MDVRMPRMTGYEACRRLKEIDATKNIPIIFLSAKGQEQEIQTGLNAGAADYILKPFAPDTLVNTINRVLNKAETG
jgi:DNA-binding response OmpR family regulator